MLREALTFKNFFHIYCILSETINCKHSNMKHKHFSYGRYVRKLVLLCSLLFTLNITTKAQNAQISGKVTSNQSDSAVSGATIAVRGSKTGTAAAEDGSFKLSVAPNATLVVSAVGYITQEVPVNNQANITIHLV